jgi:hypothetical protein
MRTFSNSRTLLAEAGNAIEESNGIGTLHCSKRRQSLGQELESEIERRRCMLFAYNLAAM